MKKKEDVYDLFTRGSALLEAGHYHQAIVPLRRAAELEAGKTSVREALGRAYFHAGRFREAADEFGVVVDLAPANDFALFCLGRSLQMTGHHTAACGPLALACCLRPERSDYRFYLERAREAIGRSA